MDDERLWMAIDLLQHALHIPVDQPVPSLLRAVEKLDLTLPSLCDLATELNSTSDTSLRAFALEALCAESIGEGVHLASGTDPWDGGAFADAADAVVSAICTAGLAMMPEDEEDALAQLSLLALSVKTTVGAVSPTLRRRLHRTLDLALGHSSRWRSRLRTAGTVQASGKANMSFWLWLTKRVGRTARGSL